MNEPSMKQVWAGMAMMAMLRDEEYLGNFKDIASDAWRMAELMEEEEHERNERRGVRQDLR